MQAMLSKQDIDTAMGRPFKRIAELTGAGFNTIIHIGAGADADLYDYQRLGFDRLLLVEGDAESAEELRAAVYDRDGVEVVEQVVAPLADRVMWHRYNLPALNGVLPPGELHTLYPRLRVIGRERVQATSLQELLEHAVLNLAERNLLFLDVPGLEDALLAQLPEHQLHAFEWVAIRSCGATRYQGGNTAGTAIERLHTHCYRLDGSLDIDLDWPVSLLRRDDVQRENTQLRGQVADLGAKLESRATAEETLNAELKRVSAERDAQTALAAERESRVHGLGQERERLTRELAESQAALKALTEAKTAHERLVTEQQAQIDSLSQARDKEAKLASDRSSVISQLTQERDDLTKLVAERNGLLKKLAQEREAQAEQVTDLQARLEQANRLQSEYDTYAAERKAELDRVNKLKQEQEARIDQLESEHSETKVRQDRLNREVIKAEAQIELIKDVLLREPGL
ncbi:hypothetical protein [Nitrococcus mobilis]|uniref:Smc1 n=1 Tax=Nitrococcus mobilis Nb-231 TaxID=314278 RepID=A4BRT9_9GAMM|nr:hypothetical protein [Nitrococcus mobilis]EAR21660.1 Smc1 [Nitrococcus mobilis Nb-231]